MLAGLISVKQRHVADPIVFEQECLQLGDFFKRVRARPLFGMVQRKLADRLIGVFKPATKDGADC